MADGGDDRAVDAAEQVTLDGAGSRDPFGAELVFSWRQVGGPSVVLAGANNPMASFVAPQVEADEVLLFELTVDNGSRTSTDSVSITVHDPANEWLVDLASTEGSLEIPDDTGDAAESVLAVAREGIASEVVVLVDIAHRERDDLLVELVAPDGTTSVLFDHSGDRYAEDIREEVAAEGLAGVEMAGAWTLRVTDDDYFAEGTVEGWRLRIR